MPCEANIATLTLRINEVHPNKDWDSSVMIDFTNTSPLSRKLENLQPAEAGDEAVSVYFIAQNNGGPNPPMMAILRTKAFQEAAVEYIRFSSPMRNRSDIHVVFKWDYSGQLSATIDGKEEHSLKTGKALTTLMLRTSGARTEFRGLKIGRLGKIQDANKICAIS